MWLDALLELDKNPGWMTDDAWVIVQIHPVEYQPDLVFQHFTETEQRRYGSTLLIFYECNLGGN
jgi:16S rRNA G966 N2-methylase RsmD